MWHFCNTIPISLKLVISKKRNHFEQQRYFECAHSCLFYYMFHTLVWYKHEIIFSSKFVQIWTCVIPSPPFPPPPTISEHLLHIWSSDEDSKLDKSFSLSFVIPQAFCLSLESYLVHTDSQKVYWIICIKDCLHITEPYRNFSADKKNTESGGFLHFSVQYLMHLTMYWCVSLNGLLYWNLSFYDLRDFFQGEHSTSSKGQVCSYRRTWLLMSPCIFNPNKLISAFLSGIWSIKTVWGLCNHI